MNTAINQSNMVNLSSFIPSLSHPITTFTAKKKSFPNDSIYSLVDPSLFSQVHINKILMDIKWKEKLYIKHQEISYNSNFIKFLLSIDLCENIYETSIIINEYINKPRKMLDNELNHLFEEVVKFVNGDLDGSNISCSIKGNYSPTIRQLIDINKYTILYILNEQYGNSNNDINTLYNRVITEKIINKIQKCIDNESLLFVVNFSFKFMDKQSNNHIKNMISLYPRVIYPDKFVKITAIKYHELLIKLDNKYENYHVNFGSGCKFKFTRRTKSKFNPQKIIEKLETIENNYEKEKEQLLKDIVKSLCKNISCMMGNMELNLDLVGIVDCNYVELMSHMSYRYPSDIIKYPSIIRYLRLHKSDINIPSKGAISQMIYSHGGISTNNKDTYEINKKFIHESRMYILNRLIEIYGNDYKVEFRTKNLIIDEDNVHYHYPTHLAYQFKFTIREEPLPSKKPLDSTIYEAIDGDYECSLCVTNKGNIANKCGHVYCYECIKKCQKGCPTCKSSWDDLREIFLIN